MKRCWQLSIAVSVALCAAACSPGSDQEVAAPPESIRPPTSEPGSTPANRGPATSEPTVQVEPRFQTEPPEVLFDQNTLHTFAIELDEDRLAEIDADPTAEEYVEGSLTFAGETIGPIGVRYKGSVGAFLGCTDGPDPLVPTGAKTCTKLSMKLKMNWLDSDDTFYGVTKVQLHSQNSDLTMLHERLGYWLFREMGVPAPRSTHARVEVNGEFVGLFALTEQIDGRFTRANFDDGSGNLYKEVWPFDTDGRARVADDFLDGLRTNEAADPSADSIATFAAQLAAAADGEELDVIDAWIDVDLFIRTMVVDRAIKHDDGPLNADCFDGCSRNNFYWYEHPTSGELTLVPWDLDNAFTNLGTIDDVEASAAVADDFGEITNDCAVFLHGPLGLPQKSAACDPLIGPISQLTDQFDVVRAELVGGPLSTARVDEQIARWSTQIEATVAEAASEHADAPTVAEWQTAVDALTSGIDVARQTNGR